jgi:two-component system, chemotaxis family, chemotaxis protein CheY
MSKRIMIVDDSETMRMMVAFTLKEKGYEVVEAYDGRCALQKLKDGPVDMMITDVNMPNLDGIELVRKIREHEESRFMPVILLTTESRESKKQEGRAVGATGWMVKPFRSEQLIGLVRKVIG